MGKRKTQEEIKSFFEVNGYELIDIYKKNNIPLNCRKNGYYYKISYVNLQAGKTPSLWGISNIDNIERNILRLLDKRKSDSEYISAKIITKSNNRRILVNFKCGCGEKFSMTVDDAIGNKYICCHKCAMKKRGRSQRKGTVKIIEYIESCGYKVLDKHKEYTTQEYIEVIDSDGYLGFVKDAGLHSGKGMSRFDIRSNKKHYIENVNHWCKDNKLSVKCIGFADKKYTRPALQFQCECGNNFVTSIASFQNGKVLCDECSKRISSYEKIFKDFLDSEDIEYIYQYSINQCRDVLPLPFDFYLPQYDLLIEIDGEGHYHPCYFNRITKEQALATYEITKKHDEIKNDFCKINNKRLLRIPYKYFNFKNDYINLFLHFIKD